MLLPFEVERFSVHKMLAEKRMKDLLDGEIEVLRLSTSTKIEMPERAEKKLQYRRSMLLETIIRINERTLILPMGLNCSLSNILKYLFKQLRRDFSPVPSSDHDRRSTIGNVTSGSKFPRPFVDAIRPQLDFFCSLFVETDEDRDKSPA